MHNMTTAVTCWPVTITSSDAPPMHAPENMWGLYIATNNGADHDGVVPEPILTGHWSPQMPPTDGDLVVRLTSPSRDQCANPAATTDQNVGAHVDSQVDIELLLAFEDRWERVGVWRRRGHDWPHEVMSTVRATARLYDALVADDPDRSSGAAASLHNPFQDWPSGLFPLLTDGVLLPGDELVWERRRKRVRHIATVRADGWLELPDGTVHATPRRAVVALGAPTDGWASWRRVSDNRSLADLRTDYRSHHYGNPGRPGVDQP
jgi:hypothetical protein